VKTHHYAVIFSSTLIDLDDSKYHCFSIEMLERAAATSGFLGVESYREKDVTISYWETLSDIQEWKQNARHLLAQKYGREEAYSSYQVRVCEVQHSYSFSK
jgi:heme-degrading monooxygenase HmoA